MIEKEKLNKNKRILIIILAIIAILLAIMLCILHIFSSLKSNNIIEDNVNRPEEYIKENPESYPLEDVLESFGCKDISYSLKKDKDGNDYYDINLRFKNNLYVNNESQEKYFDDIVKVLENKLTAPFKITDDKNNIEIYLNKNEDIYTINGVEDYFENNKFIEVNSHKTKKTKVVSKDSKELNLISINGWKRDNLKIDREPQTIDYEWIDYGDFKENYSDININYIIYNENYKSEIVDGIKVGTSFTEIKNVLGEPHFSKSNKMIGYKMDDLYAFFYDDMIVVYPNLNINNLFFEQKVLEYYNGSYNGNRTEFIVDILENYQDFKSEIIDNGIRLYSYNRGIELYLYDDKTMNIVVYDNYNFSDIIKTLAESGKLELNLDKDYINLYEEERSN